MKEMSTLAELATSSNCLLAALVVISCFLVHLLIIEPWMSPLRKIPGLTTWSLFGSAPLLMREAPGDPHLRWCQEYGDMHRFHMPFGTIRVAVLDPDVLKEILVTHCSNYVKPAFTRRSLGPIVGNGLLLSEKPIHGQHRKLINAAFKYSKIKALVPVFQQYTNVLVEKWLKKIDTQTDGALVTVIADDLNSLALDVVCKCAFDFETNALENENEVSLAFAQIVQGIGLNWRHFIPIIRSLIISHNSTARRNIQLCHNAVNSMIEEKFKNDSHEGNCLLDIMMSLKDENMKAAFKPQELHDHVMSFMLAGHETTSVALMWTLYALAKHTDIQQKLRQECLRAYEHQEEMNSDKIDELVYLNNVIKESLRLYPPAPITFREAIADDVLGGYDIPKGTIITLIAPHRHPKYFQDPLAFNPDRWETTAKNVSPYAYMPFLAGPRMCIGYRFAQLEMKIVLSSLLRRFTFDLIPNQQVKRKLALTMKSIPPIKLKISQYIEDN